MKKKCFIYHVLLALMFYVFITASLSAQVRTDKDSAVFNFKATAQSWTVPQGISAIKIDAYGAQGGGSEGGKGGRLQSILKVTPGSNLIIYVGSQPAGTEAGYNGGGKGCGKGYGGGGATDIRIGGDGLDNRVLVVGGGGGGNSYYGGGGTGAGGGLIGGEGKSMYNDAHWAIGGTQEAGGNGARAYYSPPGRLGIGGDGISNGGSCANDMMNGGGGGYYGGGGGGAGNGGGGSSYANSSNTNVVHQQGVREGNGKVVIYW